MKRVFIKNFNSNSELSTTLAQGLEWLGARQIVYPNARVFIKPNLTWKRPIPGVTVTPSFLRALIESLLPLTPNIIIGESEGGQACFQAEEAFLSHGLYDLRDEYGIQVVNLSKGKHELANALIGGEEVSVELPTLLLHEVDVFITLPVPKIHSMTGASLGFKNQWGCLGDKNRVTQHPRFDKAILAINKLLKPKLCIFDGTFFLDYTGPMIGEPVPMNLVLMGDDVGATSLACCEVMGIDPMSITHHRLAKSEGMFPDSLNQVECNLSPKEHRKRQFRLKRSLLNYINLAAFKNIAINRLFYDSTAANFLHEVLWHVRKNSIAKRVLYGKYGPGEANRGGRER